MQPDRAAPNTKETIVVIDNSSKGRARIMAAAMLVAAGASFTGLVGAAAPANAADIYVAIAAGGVNETPPVKTVGGLYIGPDPNRATAVAVSGCEGAGGRHCVFEILAQNACAVAVANDSGEVEVASDISLRRAQESAVHKLQSLQNTAYVVASGCPNGQGDLQPPPPVAAPPRLGPTVSFKPILGGLEADIADRSGVASQCTYVMDDINRTFGLPANASTDLRIVPAIPRFRDRSVTITCDNNTKTQATTRF